MASRPLASCFQARSWLFGHVQDACPCRTRQQRVHPFSGLGQSPARLPLGPLCSHGRSRRSARVAPGATRCLWLGGALAGCCPKRSAGATPGLCQRQPGRSEKADPCAIQTSNARKLQFAELQTIQLKGRLEPRRKTVAARLQPRAFQSSGIHGLRPAIVLPNQPRAGSKIGPAWPQYPAAAWPGGGPASPLRF